MINSALTTTKTAVEVVSMVQQVCSKKNFTKIQCFFNGFRKHIKILVIGISGNGKTTFLQSLMKEECREPLRTERNGHVYMKLENGRIVEFIDTPGHKTYEEERTRALNLISKGEITGVINIVSYGYAISQDVSMSEVFKTPADSKDENNIVKLDYLENNRKRELQHIDDFLSHITADDRPKWVLTVINKADVWFENKDEVMGYYESGEYNALLSKLKKVCGLYTLPFCSIIAPFGKRRMILAIGDAEKSKYYNDLKTFILGKLL